MFDKPWIVSAFHHAMAQRDTVLTDFVDLSSVKSIMMTDEEHIAFHQQFTVNEVTAASAWQHPHSMIIQREYPVEQSVVRSIIPSSSSHCLFLLPQYFSYLCSCWGSNQ